MTWNPSEKTLAKNWANRSLGLDTSIMLRLLTQEPIKEFQKAKTCLEQCFEQETKLYVSDLVITECFFALQHHYEVPINESIRALIQFLKSGWVRLLPGSVCEQALEEAQDTGKNPGLVDRIIHAQYATYEGGTLSLDKGMKKLKDSLVLS